MIHTTFGYIMYAAIGVIAYLFFSYCIREIARKQALPHTWLAWVPAARVYLLCRVAGKGALWTVLCLLPAINVVFLAIVFVRVTSRLHGNKWYGLLLFVPVVDYVVAWDIAFGLKRSWEETAPGGAGG